MCPRHNQAFQQLFQAHVAKEQAIMQIFSALQEAPRYLKIGFSQGLPIGNMFRRIHCFSTCESL